MDLNLHIIKEDLEHYHPECRISTPPTCFPLKYPVLLEGGHFYDTGYLYIADASLLPPVDTLPADIPLLVTGSLPDDYRKKLTDFISIADGPKLPVLFNEVSEIFHTYYIWENEMNQICMLHPDLKELGKTAARFFDNPFWLFDANFKIIFQIANRNKIPPEYQFYLSEDNTYIPIEGITELSADQEFIDSALSREPAIYSGEIYGFRSLCYNIFIDDIFVARLCIDEVIRPFTDKDIALIRLLGDIIAQSIMQKNFSDLNRPLDMDAVLTNLLSHILTDEQRIDNALHAYGWNMNDSYFCAAMSCRLMENTPESQTSVAAQLSVKLPANIYVIFKEKMIFIFDLTRAGLDQDTVIEGFKPLLRDNLVMAGISTVFDDLKDLYYYYDQALAAYDLGMRLHPDEWFYRFSKYNLDYLIRTASGKLICKALIPDGLKKLIRFDKEHGTQLAKLLDMYLKNNMNIAQTTRDAFLHRNTFLYQLNKIKQITGFDLEDHNTRLLLQISFKILENNRDCDPPSSFGPISS